MILKTKKRPRALGAALAQRGAGRRRHHAFGPAGRRARRRSRAASSPRSAMRAKCPARASRSSSPMTMLDPPVWHVDLYRIEDPSEIEELGLDAAADAVLLVEWPERAGAACMARSAPPVARLRAGRRQNLDSQGAPVMGGTMAAPMIPPPHAPDFLAASVGGAEILPLAGDASFRRYFRVVQGERSAVLMDAPPPHEDPRPFIAVAEWLHRRGLSAPEILARDLDKGLLLLGDFGDCAAARNARRRIRSASASCTSSRPTCSFTSTATRQWPGCKPHGLDQWLEELTLFTDWYCPAVGAEVDADAYRAAWREVLEPVAGDGLGPGDGAARLSCREHHAGRGPGRRRAFRPARFPGRACRASRPTISLRCSRTRGATCRRRSSGR